MVNPVVPETKAVNSLLEQMYAPVAKHMEQVEQRLRSEMRSRYDFVDELVRYGVLLGGKRLRPALVLLAAKACGGVREPHVLLATVLEMIHTATLVHDDVLDRAEQRRHLATVNSRWDNEASILLGDFLFSHAFFLTSLTGDAFACRRIGESTNRVCEGEIRQKGTRSKYDLSEDEYLEIIDAKTAELCACACHLGAHYAGADKQTVERMTAFGRELGIAFQIADDMLDLYGDETQTGKSLGTDLDQRLLTMPTIHALRSLPEAERDRLVQSMRDESPTVHRELLDACRQCGSLEYTRDRAGAHIQNAMDNLRHLPDSPAKTVLERIASFVIDRNH